MARYIQIQDSEHLITAHLIPEIDGEKFHSYNASMFCNCDPKIVDFQTNIIIVHKLKSETWKEEYHNT